MYFSTTCSSKFTTLVLCALATTAASNFIPPGGGPGTGFICGQAQGLYVQTAANNFYSISCDYNVVNGTQLAQANASNIAGCPQLCEIWNDAKPGALQCVTATHFGSVCTLYADVIGLSWVAQQGFDSVIISTFG